MKLTKEEKSWILYDVGNSAFVLVMVTAIMPIFFKDYASKGVADAVATANWGFANSAASLILALLSPILGTLADYKDHKMRFFTFSLCMGLLFSGALIFVGEGMWLVCLTLFVFARVGWAGSNLFYDSAIVDVTSRDRMDHISSMGYAWGYIGSVVPFLLIMALIMGAGSTGYGRDLGFSVTLLILVILFIQIVAFSFALLYGRLAGIFSTLFILLFRHSYKNMLMAGIIIYCLITCIAFMLPSIADPALQIAVFWFIAFLVASFMAGAFLLQRIEKS